MINSKAIVQTGSLTFEMDCDHELTSLRFTPVSLLTAQEMLESVQWLEYINQAVQEHNFRGQQ